MGKDILHPHVDRGRHLAAGMGVNLILQAQFQTGDAVIVGIGDAQKLRRGAGIGIIALGAGLEFQARQAQMHHAVLLIGRQLPRHQHIGMFGVGETGFQARRIGAGGLGQVARRARLVPEIVGTGIKVFHRQVAGQEFAIAVGEIGAGDDDMVGKSGRASAPHHCHVNQAQAHQRERGDAESRPDYDAPLRSRPSPHIPESGRRRGTTALALCSGVLPRARCRHGCGN